MVAGDDPGWARPGAVELFGDGGQSLLTRVFDALSDPRRRRVLRALRACEQVDVDDLAVRVAARERDVSESEVPAAARDGVRTELVHKHLPKLEDYKLIEYDHRSGTVRYGPAPTVLDEALDLATRVEDETD